MPAHETLKVELESVNDQLMKIPSEPKVQSRQAGLLFDFLLCLSGRANEDVAEFDQSDQAGSLNKALSAKVWN
jgi:hypothetical protein